MVMHQGSVKEIQHLQVYTDGFVKLWCVALE
jgi:hypothetical protein